MSAAAMQKASRSKRAIKSYFGCSGRTDDWNDGKFTGRAPDSRLFL
jgi:hypothetical protein